MSTDRKIGVFICHCGGNISDYVDVDKVRDAVEKEPGVSIAKTTMFACSDAAQQEIIEDIRKEGLDGIVVASCSPKLHLLTFRAMAERSGLNPYQYVQVNLREQCSWAHRSDMQSATEKGIHLVRAGIAKAALCDPLTDMRIETIPKVLIIGAGVSGLRAALTLSDLGLAVFLVEKSDRVGGWTGKFGKMFSQNLIGEEVIEKLLGEVKQRENVTLFTSAKLIEKSGRVGDFSVKVQTRNDETISLDVGAIIVATGFDPYQPAEEEFGYGLKGVITLPEFKQLLDGSNGEILYEGRKIRDIVYIYCVGSRQDEDEESSNLYCSRYCCTSAVHTALLAGEKDAGLNQFHLYRDMRTYGKQELIYEEARIEGSVFIKYDDYDLPKVEYIGDKLRVMVNDLLIGGEEVEIDADLVVLVTGMVPRENDELTSILKLPIGLDGFYNEIHPKLRPVETVIDGMYIVGTAQGPKTMAESVASALSGVSKSASLLMKGYVDLEPFIARVNTEQCKWCDKCTEACPYDAIEKIFCEGKEVASIIPSLCKGGGACIPVCPEDAIDLEGYTDAQIKSMIEALVKDEETN